MKFGNNNCLLAEFTEGYLRGTNQPLVGKDLDQSYSYQAIKAIAPERPSINSSVASGVRKILCVYRIAPS